jgi:glycerophosphoryl diester phosphodiesterase
LVFGHRGAAGLAPENTVPSFALALELGADVLELDVHGSRDGAIVVFHDPTLERTTDGAGPLAEHTLAELQGLDAGAAFTRDGTDFPYRGQGIRIPLLEDVLRRFPGVWCNMEIKAGTPGIVDDVLGIVRRAGAAERMVLAAEHDDIMGEIRAAADGIPTGASTTDVMGFVQAMQMGTLDSYQPPGCALQIPPQIGDLPLVTPELVAAAHAADVAVHVWTINQRDQMEGLIALGVDGIMSDLPGLARVTVDQCTRATPPPPA